MYLPLFILTGALALGCASSSNPPPAEPAPVAPAPHAGHDHQGPSAAHANCPMAVEGTTASYEAIEGGAAIVFSTTGDVTELRRRVAHKEAMHSHHHGDGPPPGGTAAPAASTHPAGMHGHGAGTGPFAHGHMGPGMASKMGPPATVESEEVEGGARLRFTPKDPADLEALRESVRQRAEKMASGSCPMMAAHGAHAPATDASETPAAPSASP